MDCTATPGSDAAPADSHRAEFDQRYARLLRHLELQGLLPKTVEAYSRGIRHMGAYFDYRIDALSAEQLSRYFSDLLASHSWSSVKLDLYGYKFYTEHVLARPRGDAITGAVRTVHRFASTLQLSANSRHRAHYSVEESVVSARASAKDEQQQGKER